MKIFLNASEISSLLGKNKFKQELLPEFSRYERWVKTFGKMIKLKVSAKDDKIIRKKLQTAHLEVEPGEVVGFAVMSFVILMFLGIKKMTLKS